MPNGLHIYQILLKASHFLFTLTLNSLMLK